MLDGLRIVAEEVLASIRKYSKSESEELLVKISDDLRSLRFPDLEKAYYDAQQQKGGIPEKVKAEFDHQFYLRGAPTKLVFSKDSLYQAEE